MPAIAKYHGITPLQPTKYLGYAKNACFNARACKTDMTILPQRLFSGEILYPANPTPDN
jgi:hypothetical protein